MKLSKSNARALLDLLKDGEITGSRLSERFRDELTNEGIIRVIYLTRTNRRVVLLDANTLLDYLKTTYGINVPLEEYISLFDQETLSRAQITSATGNSKSFKAGPKWGMFFAGFDNVDIDINGEKATVNTACSTALFVHGSAAVAIEPDVLVVGVENFENLREIGSQRDIFGTSRKKLFVEICPVMLEWMGTIPNEYLHFGDFDLAGISIYLHKVVPKLDHTKHSFYIPKNIEKLLQKGSSERYSVQYQQYRNITSQDQELQELIHLIHTYKKGLDQEYLIRLSSRLHVLS